jgi:CheY-like chemotaxis protein
LDAPVRTSWNDSLFCKIGVTDMDVQSETFVLFIVEDDPEDRLFLSFELQGSGLEKAVIFYSDVQEMIDDIRKEGEKFGKSPYSLPSLILLNTFTQKFNFREAYALIKNVDALQRIPLVLMIGSKWEEEYWQSQNFDVSGYLLKPVTLRRLQRFTGPR